MDEKRKLPSALEHPDLYDGFDGTPPDYVNPIERTDYVAKLIAARRQKAVPPSERIFTNFRRAPPSFEGEGEG